MKVTEAIAALRQVGKAAPHFSPGLVAGMVNAAADYLEWLQVPDIHQLRADSEMLKAVGEALLWVRNCTMGGPGKAFKLIEFDGDGSASAAIVALVKAHRKAVGK